MKAVRLGFGIETDILRAPCGRLIINHDKVDWTPLNDAELVLKNLMLVNAYIALNIKEEGILEDLLKIMDPKDMKGFAFDFELCCEDPETEMESYHQAGFKIAERFSDRGERPSNNYDYIWLDEMDKTSSISIIMNFIDIRKVVYVSPELHGRPLGGQRRENFYGICTDYCIID